LKKCEYPGKSIVPFPPQFSKISNKLGNKSRAYTGGGAVVLLPPPPGIYRQRLTSGVVRLTFKGRVVFPLKK